MRECGALVWLIWLCIVILSQNNEILRLNGIYTGILTRAGVDIIQVRSS